MAGVSPGDRSVMGNRLTEKCHQKLCLPRLNNKRNCRDWIVSQVVKSASVARFVKLSVRYSPLVDSSLNPFIKFTTNIQIVKNYRVGNCIVLNCVEVANKICYIPKRTLVMASSSRDIEVEEYEETVGHPDNSPVLRRSSSAESVNDVSPFQEPMMEVEEFAPTSRPMHPEILRTRASRANTSAA